MQLRNCSSHSCRGRMRVKITLGFAFNLLDDDEAFTALHLDGESSPRAGPQPRVACLNRALDVLRIDVPAVDDNELLESAGNVQLSVLQQTEIPGAAIGSSDAVCAL